MAGLAAVNLRHLKDHPGRTALSLVGIGAGSALVVAMLGLTGSSNPTPEIVLYFFFFLLGFIIRKDSVYNF